MTPLSDIELQLSVEASNADPKAGAAAMLALGEEILEHWIIAHEGEPTSDEREGFRLLALHRQGAKGIPSFNACRETCRELVYHHNLVMASDEDEAQAEKALTMMGLVATHLYLFVSGKMQVEGLGDFCCSSKPLHAAE